MISHYSKKISWLGGRYGVLLLILVVCLLFSAIWTYQLIQGRDRTLEYAQSNTANLVRIIEEANNRTLQAIDLTLNNVEISLQEGRWAEDFDIETYLRSLLRESPQIREVAFADSNGKIITSSRRGQSSPLSITDSIFFKQATQGTLPPFFISTPLQGRLLGDVAIGSHWHLIMARAVSDDDGGFKGVVLAVINPGFFQELIHALDIGENGYVAYYRYDGKLLMSGDSTSIKLGDNLHVNDVIFSEHLSYQEWGTFIQKGNTDESTDHIISYRATSRWPVLIAVGLDQEEVLLSWRAEARRFSLLMAGSLLVLTILAVIVYSQHVAQEKLSLKLLEAHHDVLTGLPSLRLCIDRLSNALLRARREEDVLAVFFVDLDGFKAINDTHGHGGGDYVLQQIAGRLSASVRQMDTVGRLGGDEFLIVLPMVKNAKIVERIAVNIMNNIRKPLLWNGEQLSVSASIGISMFPGDGADANELIKKADHAMYRTKYNGKNNFRLASVETQARKNNIVPESDRDSKG